MIYKFNSDRSIVTERLTKKMINHSNSQRVLFNALIVLIISLIAIALSASNAYADNSSSPNQLSQTKQSEQPMLQAGGYYNISNSQLQTMLEKGLILVDIRRAEEWQQTGIVKGSHTLTFFDKRGNINPNFVAEFTALAKPDQAVALICRTGNRTRAASQAIAQQLGYKQVYNVTTGITGWLREKRAVVNVKAKSDS